MKPEHSAKLSIFLKLEWMQSEYIFAIFSLKPPTLAEL